MLEKLPEVDRNFVKSQVAEGYYASEIEVVRDAVRRLRKEEQRAQKQKSLYDLVMEGERSIQEGRVHRFTPELFDKIWQEGIEKAQKGGKIRDDVLP